MHSRLQLLSTVSAVDDLPMRLGRLVETSKKPTKNYIKRAPEPLKPGLSIKDGKMAYSPPIEHKPQLTTMLSNSEVAEQSLMPTAEMIIQLDTLGPVIRSAIGVDLANANLTNGSR